MKLNYSLVFSNVFSTIFISMWTTDWVSLYLRVSPSRISSFLCSTFVRDKFAIMVGRKGTGSYISSILMYTNFMLFDFRLSLRVFVLKSRFVLFLKLFRLAFQLIYIYIFKCFFYRVQCLWNEFLSSTGSFIWISVANQLDWFIIYESFIDFDEYKIAIYYSCDWMEFWMKCQTRFHTRSIWIFNLSNIDSKKYTQYSKTILIQKKNTQYPFIDTTELSLRINVYLIA